MSNFIPSQSAPRWIVLILAVITLVAFSNVHEFSFIHLDDVTFVTNNPEIREGITAKGLQWAAGAGLLFSSPHAEYWQPVTLMARMAITHFLGLDPAAHHLINLALHLLNVLLLWHVLRKLTSSMLRSALVAALFAIHPLRVESVAWVTEIKDLLSGLFFLLSIWAYLRYVAHRCLSRYLVLAGLFALALMSKPMTVTLPCVLLMLDFWPLRQAALRKEDSIVWTKLFFEKSLLFALSLGSGLLTLSTQSRMLGVNPQVNAFVQSLASYALYIKRSLIPWPLAVHYPPIPPDIALAWACIGFLLLAIITLLLFQYRTRQPALLIGWGWFIVTLAPVVGLGDITTADRFTYIPSIGLGILLVWGGDALLHFLSSRYAWNLRTIQNRALLFFVLYLGFLICLTHTQASHWRNTSTLFEHCLQVVGDDYISHDILADVRMKEGHSDQALIHFSKAASLAPNYPEARARLARALQHLGKVPDAAQAWQTVLNLDPNHEEANFNLGNILAQRGDSSLAIACYERYLAARPKDAMIHYNLGVLLLRKNQTAESLKHIEICLKLKPDFELALNVLQKLRKQKPSPQPHRP